jgi:heme/copper-type cytochrome/quinol oxidase subunit 3
MGVIYLNLLQNIIHLKINRKYFFYRISEFDYLLSMGKFNSNVHLILNNIQLSSQRHIFFEVSAWYWHFVDIV